MMDQEGESSEIIESHSALNHQTDFCECCESLGCDQVSIPSSVAVATSVSANQIQTSFDFFGYRFVFFEFPEKPVNGVDPPKEHFRLYVKGPSLQSLNSVFLI